MVDDMAGDEFLLDILHGYAHLYHKRHNVVGKVRDLRWLYEEFDPRTLIVSYYWDVLECFWGARNAFAAEYYDFCINSGRKIRLFRNGNDVENQNNEITDIYYDSVHTYSDDDDFLF